jgi:hypothetical protein
MDPLAEAPGQKPYICLYLRLLAKALGENLAE